MGALEIGSVLVLRKVGSVVGKTSGGGSSFPFLGSCWIACLSTCCVKGQFCRERLDTHLQSLQRTVDCSIEHSRLTAVMTGDS